MCGGNIRLALDYIRFFIGSAHTNTERVLKIYRGKGSFDVPLHDFLRSWIYGEHEYYSPDSSEILNLFDISTPDGKEHFLAPILLAQLELLSQQSLSEGYVDYANVISYMQSYGFTPSQLDWSLERLTQRNLINSPTRTFENKDISPLQYYRLTSIGAYYIKDLIKQFTYIDAMVIDTPLTEDCELSNNYYANTTSERLERANLFWEYLDSQWQALEGYQVPFDWPSARATIKNGIKYIRSKISEYQS